MIENGPIVIVKNLLVTGWDATNTPLADAPRFHTGWYDFGSSDPQVTVTNPESSVVNGGDTGQTAGTGDGGVSQVRAGTVLVNAWAGTRDDLEGAGTNGGDVNPKDAAYQMAAEVHRIIQSNAQGTSTATGDPELTSLGADATRRVVDTDVDPVVYRYEVTVRFSYVVRTA